MGPQGLGFQGLGLKELTLMARMPMQSVWVLGLRALA